MDRSYGDMLPFPDGTPDLLTHGQIMRLLGISNPSAHHLLGRLPAIDTERGRAVRRDDLEDYVRARAGRRLTGGRPRTPRFPHAPAPRVGATRLHPVRLIPDERAGLERRLRDGTLAGAPATRARALLLADEGGGSVATDRAIADALGIGVAAVAFARRAYAAGGIDAALTVPGPGKLGGEVGARLIALAAEPPPAGRARWSYRALAIEAVARGIVDSITHEGVRLALERAGVDLRRRRATGE